jgi:hypothetical protein
MMLTVSCDGFDAGALGPAVGSTHAMAEPQVCVIPSRNPGLLARNTKHLPRMAY